jgi:8-oxo-dGTP pyrophosphatase MutT (NUDIX family)
MDYVGHGNYVVVVFIVGGSNIKASNIKLVLLQREPRAGKTWPLAGLILPNEDLVDAAVRELV